MEQIPVPWGMEQVPVSSERVREGDWVLHRGAWCRVRDMRRSEHGRVLHFKGHPPKTVDGPLTIARKTAYPGQWAKRGIAR
ncbi:hypothetical protein GCM10010319_58770 [Streptomyces blastmyceticus]|uniref:Uncharacterized protein n=1 Tax=Streptomyces blastmyceticus TaxID=68180 RepID=A0ABN0XUC7_9ACTN